MCYDIDMTDLTAAGLTTTEANCYQALLEKREWKPAELAKYVHETRTNCYKILDKLVTLKLATRFDKDKKLHYRATSPARLIELAHEHRAARERAEKELELQAQSLMNTYFKSHEQAGIRYFQGKDGIQEIFEDLANTKKPIHFMHTIAGINYYGFDAMHELRMLAVNAGVPRRALTPDTELATQDYATTDALVHLKRTWLRQTDYTAPVEWGVYDDKMYLISYGTEAMGIIIESPQIAAAFKEVYFLLERGQKALPDYDELPKLAQQKGRTTSSKTK